MGNVCISGDGLLLNSTNLVKHTQEPFYLWKWFDSILFSGHPVLYSSKLIDCQTRVILTNQMSKTGYFEYDYSIKNLFKLMARYGTIFRDVIKVISLLKM